MQQVSAEKEASTKVCCKHDGCSHDGCNVPSLHGKTIPFFSLMQPDLSNFTRSELKDYFLNSYDLYELLFSAIEDDIYFYKSPDRLRLALIFYLGHTASMYINKLMLGGLIQKRVNMHFETMFETGVDEMSWDDTENYRMGGALEWPTVVEVMEYRKQVRQIILDLIDNAPLDLPVTPDHQWWCLFMGIEHERIHFETSSVLLNQLPVHMLKRPTTWKYAPLSMDSPAGPNELVTVLSGDVVMGKPELFPSFGWDNEYGQVKAHVPEFQASKYLVTNKEFLDFIEDGGYQRKELWTEEGWRWASFREAKHPIYWVCEDGCKSGCGDDLASYSHCAPLTGESANTPKVKYRYRAIFDVIDMPWDWPVITNYHEVKAFCSWKGPGYRAPTEAEHHRMRADPVVSCDKSCDPAFSPHYPANINLKYGSPSPVNAFAPSATGHYDVYGNLWEWGEDHLNGFPGFKTHYLYEDFSTPFYDGRHTMMMGGSWVSTGAESSRFARFGFRRHFFQHAGFRLARSNKPAPVRLCKAEIFLLNAGVLENPVTIPDFEEQCLYEATNQQFSYETQRALKQQLAQEYGNVQSYGIPMMAFVEEMATKYSINKNAAIIFGSGGGLTSFLLTKYFKLVVGVDFSGRFVDAALSIQAGKGVRYNGDNEAILPSIEGIDPNRVTFKQLTWIPNEIVNYDLIVFEFADRVTEPRGWMSKLWESLTPHGIVIFLASNKWGKTTIQHYIGKWFIFMEESIVANKNATVWKLISAS